MLTLKVLNEAASLNDFKESTSYSFLKGTDFTLIMRIYDTSTGIRRVLDEDDEVTINLTTSTGTDLEKTATFPFAGDRSIIKIEVTDTESENLLGGNIVAEILEDATSKIFKAVGNNLLVLEVAGSC